MSSHADTIVRLRKMLTAQERYEFREALDQLWAENQQLRDALQAILDVPFDVTRSAYADASDIAAAALAAVRVEER